MSRYAQLFRNRCHTIAAGAGFTMREVLGEFGLVDFMESKVDDDFTPFEIAEEAVVFFCEGKAKQERCFRFGILAVCFFLHQDYKKQLGQPSAQTVADLVSLITTPCDRTALVNWMNSHFS